MNNQKIYEYLNNLFDEEADSYQYSHYMGDFAMTKSKFIEVGKIMITKFHNMGLDMCERIFEESMDSFNAEFTERIKKIR